MTDTLLFVAALATWQIVEILHHSELFAGWRATAEVTDTRWRSRLFLCPWCLSVWVALATISVLSLADFLAFTAIKLPLYALAISRLANLGNDVFHRHCRTPDLNREPEAPANILTIPSKEPTA